MKERSSGVFFIVLILAVLITVMIVVFSAKKDIEEVENVQQQITDGEESVQELDNTVKDLNKQNEQPYDDLENQLNGTDF